MASKPNPSSRPAEVDPETKRAVVAEIARQRARLDAMRVAITRRILELEAAGAVPEQPSAFPDVRTRAAELMNGAASLAGLAAPLKVPGADLWEVYRDREAVDLALDALRQQELPARAAVLASMLPSRRERWIELTRQIALALIAVNHLVDERDAVRGELLRWGIPEFPLAFDPRGNISARETARCFVESAVRLRIISAGEVKNVS